MITSHRLRAFLWRWHKRVGLCCALLVIMVTLTGLVLNHTSELKLGRQGVEQNWLLGWYGIEPASLQSVSVNETWVSADTNGHVYYGLNKVASCTGELKGAVYLPPFIAVACGSELVLLSAAGVYQERLGSLYGIPDGITRVGVCDANLCLEVSDSVSLFDLNSLQIGSVPESVVVQWSPPPVPAASVKSLEVLSNRATAQRLDWERVLLDLHSGRIAGYAGVLLVDLAALGLLFLALSGFWIWYRSAARVNRRRGRR